jgi:hypothetical protein
LWLCYHVPFGQLSTSCKCLFTISIEETSVFVARNIKDIFQMLSINMAIMYFCRDVHGVWAPMKVSGRVFKMRLPSRTNKEHGCLRLQFPNYEVRSLLAIWCIRKIWAFIWTGLYFLLDHDLTITRFSIVRQLLMVDGFEKPPLHAY